MPARSPRCHGLNPSWGICSKVLGPLCRALCHSLLQSFPLALPVIHSPFHLAPWRGRCKVVVLFWFPVQGLLWENLLARGCFPCYFSLYIFSVYRQFMDREFDCKLLKRRSECELLSHWECLSWRVLIYSACPWGHPGESRVVRGPEGTSQDDHQATSWSQTKTQCLHWHFIICISRVFKVLLD